MQKIVGALGVAAVIGVVLVLLRPAPASKPDTAAVVNPPEPAIIDAPPYLAAFPLEPIAAPAALGDAAADRALDRALAPYRRQDYVGAASALEQMLLDFPREPRAVLYLGVARLLSGEPQNALEILGGMPTSSEGLAAEAEWYTLVGIARLRDPRDAGDRARGLCAADGPNKARACAAVDALSNATGTSR